MSQAADQPPNRAVAQQWQHGRVSPPPNTWAVVGRTLAVLVAGTAAVFTAFLVYLLLRALLGDPSGDPHGYVRIFGSMLLVPTACFGAFALPFVVRRDQASGKRVTMWAAIAWIIGSLVLAGVALGG